MKLIKKGDTFIIKAIGEWSAHYKSRENLVGKRATATEDFTPGLRLGGKRSKSHILQCGEFTVSTRRSPVYCCSIYVKDIRRASTNGNS